MYTHHLTSKVVPLTRVDSGKEKSFRFILSPSDRWVLQVKDGKWFVNVPDICSFENLPQGVHFLDRAAQGDAFEKFSG